MLLRMYTRYGNAKAFKELESLGLPSGVMKLNYQVCDLILKDPMLMAT